MKKRCLALFPCDFHECYGTSEIGIAANLAPGDWEDHLGSVGRALPYVELKIVGSHGEEMPPGEAGEIICSTPTAFAGYFQRPDFTRASVIDGFFYTGDLGYLDRDGFLYLCGRKKELIIVGGTNVYPQDVEAVVGGHPQVKECAVIGIDDPRFGEAVLAVIVPAGDSVDIRSIQRLCVEELADYQQPMAYEVVTELPRNPLGKIMKHKLKKRFEGYDATARLRALINGT
jgi:long-chain acyl-CoA synthetase